MGEIRSNCLELEQELIRIKSELKASKRREILLKETETSFRLFYENSSDALLITSPDGGVHAVNPAGCKLFGWSEEEMCKGGRDMLVDLTDKTLPVALKKREKEGYVEGELIFKKKGGATFVGEYTSSIFFSSDGLARTSMIIRDVTERKEAERLLNNRQKELIELNTTKDKLFSIVAHDLRGPFNNLKGLSELIIKKLNNNKVEEAQEYAHLISSSAKKSITLLENLLKWAQTQTGELKFEPEEINLSDVILDIIELKRSLLISKEISLKYEPLKDLHIYADQNMFRLVVRNLISNAIKFTNSGGRIELRLYPKKEQVEISVSDNGIGMNKKQLKELFDISVSKTSPGTAGEKGSGLGLVICKEFVEKHGGEIWALSEAGKGTDFRFTMPFVAGN